MSKDCETRTEYRYRDVSSLAELGDEMSQLSEDGFVVELDRPARCDEEHDDGEAWKARAMAEEFRISATRERCRCVCEACGHRNGDEQKKKASKK